MSQVRDLNLLNPRQADSGAGADAHPEMWFYYGDGSLNTCLADDNENSGVVQQNTWYPVGASTVNPSTSGIWGGNTAADVETAQDLQDGFTVIAATFHLRYLINTWGLTGSSPVLGTGLSTASLGLTFLPQPLVLGPGIKELVVPIDGDHMAFGAPTSAQLTVIFSGLAPVHDAVNGQYLNLTQDSNTDDSGDTSISFVKAWYEIEYVSNVVPPVGFEANLSADLGAVNQAFKARA